MGGREEEAAFPSQLRRRRRRRMLINPHTFLPTRLWPDGMWSRFG
jgi:hypothetical protein